MEVISKVYYRFDGKDYPTIRAIQEELENRIGAIVDLLPGDFGIGERLKVYDWLVSYKADLVPLLSVSYDRSDNALYPDQVNVIDY